MAVREIYRNRPYTLDDVGARRGGNADWAALLKLHSHSPSILVAASDAADFIKDGADRVCSGAADELDLDWALNQLPSGGGVVLLSPGTFTFAAAASRAIDNVLVQGCGVATHIDLDDSTAVIDAGTQSNWKIIDIDTDLGGVDIATALFSLAIYSKDGTPVVDVSAMEVTGRKIRTYLHDDFMGAAIDETSGPWALHAGADAQAIDPAVDLAELGGACKLVTGNVGDGIANDGSQIVGVNAWKASMGGLVMEAHVRLNTAITTVQICVGFTDNKATLELPAAVGGSDAITTTFSDGLVFCFDTDADTDEWFAIGVKGDTDATGNGATGVAPVAGTVQVLRIEVDADGAAARFYIDGVLVKSLTANAVTAGTAIYPTAVMCATTTTSRDGHVDRIDVEAIRA